MDAEAVFFDQGENRSGVSGVLQDVVVVDVYGISRF
jgi:hypothetical protein